MSNQVYSNDTQTYPISNLSSIGATTNLNSNTFQLVRVNTTIVGNVSQTVLTFPVPLNTSPMFISNLSAFCTQGPDAGKTAFFSSCFGAKNSAGTVTAYPYGLQFIRDPVYTNPAVTLNVVGTNAVLQVGGSAGDTINWVGSIQIFS